jgi:chromosome segregation ATPase
MKADEVLTELAQTRRKLELEIQALPGKEKNLKIQLKQVKDDFMKAERVRGEALTVLHIAEQRYKKPRQQYIEIKSQIDNIPKVKNLFVEELENIKEQISVSQLDSKTLRFKRLDIAIGKLDKIRKKLEADIRALPYKEKSLRTRLKSSHTELRRAEHLKEEALKMLKTAEQVLIKTRQQNADVTTRIENIHRLKVNIGLKRSERFKKQSSIMLESAENRLLKKQYEYRDLRTQIDSIPILREMYNQRIRNIYQLLSISRSCLKNTQYNTLETSDQDLLHIESIWRLIFKPYLTRKKV